MKQLQPVIWTKGTFLTPQHLQTQDRFIEDSLNFRLQALKFCAWGFNELVINQELLSEGELVISRAAGIFPDGLLFDFPDAVEVLLQLSAIVGAEAPLDDSFEFYIDLLIGGLTAALR